MAWWQEANGATAIGEPPPVSALTHDSRLVAPGGAFVAVPGRQSDGHDFLEAALNAGAGALVVQEDHRDKWRALRERVALVVVPDTRAALGPLAAAAYGNPSHRLLGIGITGTDGKTTTSHLAGHVLSALGLPCGYLTSVGFDAGSGFAFNATHMTTVEAPLIQATLAEAVKNHRAAMAIESSSEGLAQHRLAGCEFDAAIFTNLTRDHLDFHGTMEAYRDAKGLLFRMLDEEHGKHHAKFVVVNVDDAVGFYMAGLTHAGCVTYGIENEADFTGRSIRESSHGLEFEVVSGGHSTSARAPLFGRFNVYNCLAVIALARAYGFAVDKAVDALESFPGIPGRMERIECGQDFTVVVDIASTPAALENVLKALRPATAGRLWAVFGAAGRRDPARRAGMGEIAGRLADRVVVTNEDPRDEDPEAIIAAIAGGLDGAGRHEGEDYWRVPDRREAIRLAVSHAAKGDTVLLAGKATEPTMVFANEAVPWDERAEARALLGGDGHQG